MDSRFQHYLITGSAEQAREGYEDEEEEEITNFRAEDETTEAPEEITYIPDDLFCTYFPEDEVLTDAQIQDRCDTIPLVKLLCMTTCKYIPPTTTTTEYSGPPTTTTAAPVPRGYF